MLGFTYTIAFQMQGQSGIMGAVNNLSRLDRGILGANRQLGVMGAAFEQAGRRGRAAFDSMKGSLSGFITKLGIGLGLLDSLKTAANVESMTNTITMLSDNAAEGGKNMEFLRNTAEKYGLALTPLMEGFTGLNAAMRDLPDSKVRQMFEGFSIGARGMNLTEDATNRAFYAIQQMASKPFLSSEEINQQLGDAMPGSQGVMARAMGMGVGEFMEAVQKKLIKPDKFLPAFANQLVKEFGGVAASAADGANANFARLNNTMLDFKTTIGKDLLPAVLPFIKDYLIPGIKWIGENIRVVGLLTGAVWLLNFAMYANPLGLIVAAVVAVVGAVIWAWNEFSEFRGVVLGTWEALKPFASFLWDVLIFPFQILGKVVGWAWGKFQDFMGWVDTKKESLKQIGTFIYDYLIKPFTFLDEVLELLAPQIDGIMKRFQKGYGEGLAMTPLLGSHRGDNVPGGALAAAFGGNNLADYYNERDDRSLGGGGKPKGNGGGGSLTKGIEGITGGGSKNVTINLSSLIHGNIEFHSTTHGENSDKLRDTVQRELLQVLNSANMAQ